MNLFSEISNWIFSQYADTPIDLILIESIAVFFGIVSPLCSLRNNIWVFPTGLINTAAYSYLLLVYELFGDMLINLYYFIMSIYGWYYWSKTNSDKSSTHISYTTKAEKQISLLLLIISGITVIAIYYLTNRLTNWMAFTDSLTTALFFTGMWLMARRKIENWHCFIIGNAISIPLYYYKGLIFSSILFILLTLIAIFGLKSWKKLITQQPALK